MGPQCGLHIGELFTYVTVNFKHAGGGGQKVPLLSHFQNDGK